MTERLDFDPVGDIHAGSEHNVLADHHVAAQARIVAEIHGFRIGQRGPVRHRGSPRAVLHQALDLRQFGAGIDADDFVGVRLHDAAGVACGSRHSDRVGQVELAFALSLPMLSSRPNSLAPSNAIRPALHNVTARCSSEASRYSAIASRPPSVSRINLP